MILYPKKNFYLQWKFSVLCVDGNFDWNLSHSRGDSKMYWYWIKKKGLQWKLPLKVLLSGFGNSVLSFENVVLRWTINESNNNAYVVLVYAYSIVTSETSTVYIYSYKHMCYNRLTIFDRIGKVCMLLSVQKLTVIKQRYGRA